MWWYTQSNTEKFQMTEQQERKREYNYTDYMNHGAARRARARERYWQNRERYLAQKAAKRTAQQGINQE
jgi:hypothetical protein